MKAVPPIERDFESVAMTLPERAQALQITDQKSYDLVVAELDKATAFETEIIEHHKPQKDYAYKTHRAICAAEKKLLDPVQKAKEIFRKLISGWHTEQERLRLEAERQAQEEAAKEEEAFRLEMAVQAEVMGASPAEVADMLETPFPVTQRVVALPFQKAAGLSDRLDWYAEVTDIRALCEAVASGRFSNALVLPNMPVLNSFARNLKQTMNIPGVAARSKPGITRRK
jgi:hypothetical protein